MHRFVCVLAAGCLFLSACEKKTETAPETSAKPGETATAPPAQPAQPSPAPDQQAPAPAGQTAAPGAAPQLPGMEQVTYPIDLETGAKVYREVCATCHREGIAGAPKLGDVEAWKPRIAKGAATLVQNSIKGYQGNQGVMPPKGGAASLADADVASAAIYMASQASGPAPAK